MKRTRLDAESILRQLAEIRRAIPRVAPAPPPPATEGRARDVDGRSSWWEEDFDDAAVADGLSSLADELTAAIDHAAAAATEKALEIYYCHVALERVGDLRPPVGWLQAAATQATLGHRRGAAAQQTGRRRKARTLSSVTRHQAAEELARDPAHAELIAYVERMRAAE